MDEFYIYGFEISTLNKDNETEYTVKVELDIPFIEHFEKQTMWEHLQEVCINRFRISKDLFDNPCLFTCFYSDFDAEYDQHTLHKLRDEYCGSIVIRNEYDSMSKVINAL